MAEHSSTTPAEPTQAGPETQAGPGQRADEELARTRAAQAAHGGSMAPSLVDETGHPVGDAAAGDPIGGGSAGGS